MRYIEDILHFREDISPFVVHLTREKGTENAKDVLLKIIKEKRLICSDKEVSSARYGIKTFDMDSSEKKRYFSAICLTETPLNEIHCLLEIYGRQVELQPYGLVFMKKCLMNNHNISPVLYLNNIHGKASSVVEALCSLIESRPNDAEKLLPLIEIFGRKITPPGGSPQEGNIDFRWEREWRLPSCYGSLTFEEDDVFIGLCPHKEIQFFENQLLDIDFVDPRRNMKWYAKKLVDARNRLGIKNSVV
jgi:hypothetical protein